MNLREYFIQERGTAAKLARVLGLNQSMLWQWASGTRPVGPERCVEIEVATASAVMRWDLRASDWHRIWPELAARPDAPPTPVSSAATVGNQA